jgi:hypothetical protein
MNRLRTTAATLGLMSACLVPSMRADDSNKETRFTINKTPQVQDILLPPGQHMFKLTEPGSDLNVVSVYGYGADGTRRLDGVVTGWSAYRIDAGGKSLFGISQPQGSQPAKLQTWYYPGESFGIEFPIRPRANGTRHLAKSKGKGQNADAPSSSSSTSD